MVALPVFRELYNAKGFQPRLTSSTEKAKGRLVNSFHYKGLAFDLGTLAIRLSDNARAIVKRADLEDIVIKAKKKLGKDYDVVLKKDHIHVEYDVK